MLRKAVSMTSTLVAGAILIACSKEPSTLEEPDVPNYASIATLNELMVHVVDPAADIVWESVGTIIDKNGVVELRPETDEQWGVVLGGAITLMEFGNLLLVEGRRASAREWTVYARAMIDASSSAVRAARDHDADAILAVGEAIYHACIDCHEHFMPDAE